MVQFFLLHPMGETILLVLVAAILVVAHRKGRVKGRVTLEVIGFIAATVIGFWIPGVFFVLAALVYAAWRIIKG